MSDRRFIEQRVYVGYYGIGNSDDGSVYPLSIHFERRPRWLHRYMARLLLGWQWVDT